MHAAPLTSPRLQRVLRALRGGEWRSTRALVRGAGVMAVSACVAELRTHGARIECRRRRLEEPRIWIWEYRLLQEPTE